MILYVDTSAFVPLLIDLWPQFDVVELDGQLMAAAAQAAITRGLRGYDSVSYVAAAVAAVAVIDTNAPS